MLSWDSTNTFDDRGCNGIEGDRPGWVDDPAQTDRALWETVKYSKIRVCCLSD